MEGHSYVMHNPPGPFTWFVVQREANTQREKQTQPSKPVIYSSLDAENILILSKEAEQKSPTLFSWLLVCDKKEMARLEVSLYKLTIYKQEK